MEPVEQLKDIFFALQYASVLTTELDHMDARLAQKVEGMLTQTTVADIKKLPDMLAEYLKTVKPEELDAFRQLNVMEELQQIMQVLGHQHVHVWTPEDALLPGYNLIACVNRQDIWDLKLMDTVILASGMFNRAFPRDPINFHCEGVPVMRTHSEDITRIFSEFVKKVENIYVKTKMWLDECQRQTAEAAAATADATAAGSADGAAAEEAAPL